MALHEELNEGLAAIHASAARIDHEEAYLIQENVAAMQELLAHNKELNELSKPNITKNRIDEIAGRQACISSINNKVLPGSIGVL